MSDFPDKTQDSLFITAFSALPDAACILEPLGGADDAGCDWRYLSSNPAFCQLLQVDDLAGMSLRARFPKVAQQWSDHFHRALSSKTSQVVTQEDPDQPRLFEVSLTPLAHGEYGAVLARVRDVTSEHLARERRREADARYKLLFDAIDEGFCIIDVIFDDKGTPVDYRFVEANNAFVSHTGLIDPIGKTMRALQPDIEDHWPAIYGRIAMGGVAERFESESSAMGRWFDVFAFPIGEQAPYQLGILFEDVGQRKAMEMALRHSENRLHSLIEATSDLIFQMNPDATEMQQVGGRDLLGNPGAATNWIEAFVLDSDRAAVQAAVAAAISNRQPIEIEHRVVTAQGALKWLSSRAVPVLGDDGEIAEWFGMAADITTRRQVEQQLSHGAQMLRVASEIGRVGLWDWNVESGELTWSDEHFRMEGYEPGEIVPTYDVWAARLHPEDRATTEAKIADAMRTGGEYLNEYRVCQPNGDVRWLSARGRFLFGEQGQAVRMLGAIVDTTQRRREEEWQRLLVAELQHRVRNLIGMVRSVARLSAPSHRNVSDYVDHLIGRLQAMGRTQSTLTRSPGRSVDLSELVREELLVHAAQPDQYHLDGPPIALSPHAAEIVTLAIHELAANSIKYGALGDTGYIRIVWKTLDRDGKPWISLRWQETAPPHKTKFNRKGFGRRLIEERVPYELQGEGRFEIHDTGVLAQLDFPLSNAGSILETRS
ncbi:MAG: PAS domain-containing protein [Sphingomonadales bacterium]|nr:PAS domain-containing protein [Sphingomonadales bacterium]NCQ20716.1 PAS domain-containing protein [Sphingomonadales bacterium]NCT03714.1 PAS domain-containing protein [Sphingomonadales bacterium]